MFMLPISGVPVRLAGPRGQDELLLAEGSPGSLALRVEVARRLAPPGADSVDWAELPFADVDAALLGLRQRLVGERMLAEVRCESCGGWGDVPISIPQYLASKNPKRVAGAAREADGWWRWRDVRFRVPTTADVLEECGRAGSASAAAEALQRRCVLADSPEVLARVNTLLDRLAPPLSGQVQGTCPACQNTLRGWFDPGAFVLAELQARAFLLFDHIHLLASCYGWSEEAILALPSQRRALYASLIAEDRSK